MKWMAVYILRCSDNSYYTGVTNDLDVRLRQHQLGENISAYTYSRRPVKLVFFEQFNDPIQAIEFEKQVKGWSRKKKEAIIARNLEKLKELSICKNTTSHLHYKNKSK